MLLKVGDSLNLNSKFKVKGKSELLWKLYQVDN